MDSVIVEKEKKVLTMAEYIEREALMRRIKELHCAECDSYHGVRCRACWVDDTLDYIDSEPAADVAPVVRCRDCKHAWIHPCGYVYCHRDGRNAYEMTFNLDSFCSYGERKDNG